MTSIRDKAVHCEAKKHGYRQTQDGVVVSFVLHPQEVPDQLAVAALGTRYQLAMVEIGDDEQPKEVMPTGLRTTTVDTAPGSKNPAGRARKGWDELNLSAQVGIRCNEPAFWKFIEHDYGEQKWAGWPLTNNEDAAQFIRIICRVSTRADIMRGNDAGNTWLRIDSRYRAWQREAEVVG